MGSRRLGVARALVGDAWMSGDVEVDSEGRIGAVGVRPAGSRGAAVPGFVDLQVNGFAGVDFTRCDLDGYRDAALAMARTGVTSYLLTIPTAPPDRYDPVLALAARAIADASPGARPLGVHLEGPFLTRPGAHPVDWLRPASLELADSLLDAAPVAMMTLAPEAEGALELIGHLSARGVIASVGHTNADAAQTHRAFDAGARAVTHLWNAQTTVTARAPGVVGAALARRDVFVGIIADLVHLAADTLALSLAALGRRAVIVSDATPFAALPDGADAPEAARGATLRSDGSVRLDDGTLAGSATPLDVQLRNVVALGVPLDRAVHCMTAAPAELLGRSDVGRLRPGNRADVVVLDDELEVVRTLVSGREP